MQVASISHCTTSRPSCVLSTTRTQRSHAPPALNSLRQQHGRKECRSQRHILRASSLQGAGAGPGMAPELKQAIEDFLEKNKVVLFMKGTRQFPQCGFSNTCVQILNTMNIPYETVNILEDESIRSGMKDFSQWPTFPQLYINSEFVGGCDITIEAYQNGELREMLEVALSS